MVLAGMAVEQSKEALRVTTNRFEQGLEKPTDWHYAESQFLETALANSESDINHNHSPA